jgi:hypothetical protein
MQGIIYKFLRGFLVFCFYERCYTFVRRLIGRSLIRICPTERCTCFVDVSPSIVTILCSYHHATGARCDLDRMVVGFITAYMQSVPVTTNVKNSNPAQGGLLDTTLWDLNTQLISYSFLAE